MAARRSEARLARPELPAGLRDEPALEFPDWSAAARTGIPVSAERMLRLSLEYVRHAGSRPGFEELRARRKVVVEFVL